METKKQQTASHFSAEAEYRVMAAATRKIKWMRQLMYDLGFLFEQSVRLFCDSQAAIHIAVKCFMRGRNTLRLIVIRLEMILLMEFCLPFMCVIKINLLIF